MDVTKALSILSGEFFIYLYDSIFGQVPSAVSVITAPTDPPLPPIQE